VLSAFGLAASAGLNAYVPLLIVAIIVPVVVAVVLILLTAFVIWLLWRRANRSMQAPRV
jgi:hypothetical protein